MDMMKIGVMTCVLLSSQFANAGSVSGGGGGTLPGDKIQAKDVIEAVTESRSVIDAYLKGIEGQLVLFGTASPRYQNFNKMFSPGNDVFKFLGEVPFRIISDGSCHDSEGTEVDASANTDIEGGICVSVSRIQPKLTFANYRAEIGALMLHEIAHLFGSEENEAIEIQKLAARFLAGSDPYDIGDWTFNVMQSLDQLRSMTEMISGSLKSGTKIHCDNFSKLSWSYTNTLHSLVGGSLMYLIRERDVEYYWQLNTRVKAMGDFLCTQEGYESENFRQLRVETFNKIWGTDLELTAHQYEVRAYNDPNLFNRFPLVQLKIRKYSSPGELPKDLDATVRDVDALRDLLKHQWHMKFNL